jgi:hypothetical protein
MVSSKYKRLRIERFLVWSTVFFCSANVFAGVGGQSPAGRLFLAQASAEAHTSQKLRSCIRNIMCMLADSITTVRQKGE